MLENKLWTRQSAAATIGALLESGERALALLSAADDRKM
jgi:hypothetical protein